jgi:hypothetical protein
MTRAYIVAEIQRTAVENGGHPLGWRRFSAATGIRQRDWEKHWARFSDAVAEAGFRPNQLNPALTEPVLLQALAGFTRELGHPPTYSELRHKGHGDLAFPDAKTFQRLGSKPTLISKLRQFCEGNPEYADVAALCAPVPDAAEADSRPNRGKTAEVSFGSVYLLRSGRHYKIGRSNAVGRRERELAIQLPEPANVVHSIRTDDPVGIETYWHARFADRRKNGEWFALSAEDVAAFKRRKFM